MKKQVLGVRIDDVSQREVLESVSAWLEVRHSGLPRISNKLVRDGNGDAELGQHDTKLIFTPGPEFLVSAQKDAEFKRILNSADLNVPDGFGLHFSGVVNRIAGVDLMVALCEVAEQKKWTVGLLGGRDDVAKKAVKKLQEKFPNLKVSFAISDEKADQIVSHYLIDSSIALSSDLVPVDILFVGLGHPRQEKLLAAIRNLKFEIRNKSKISNPKIQNKFEISNFKFQIGVGVGGSFDLIAGVKKRAPKIVSSLGFEWLWRMMIDPKHIFRVWRATGEFVWLLMKQVYLSLN